MGAIYVVAAVGSWNKDIFVANSKKLEGLWLFCSTPNELNLLLKNNEPKYIFFPHWRWVVPESVLNKSECVCFHMTDVPYGRGGSPLQNLIVRGHKETVLTALKMEKGLDTGPVYLKKKLSLDGSAAEIYKRASSLTWELIKELIQNKYKPTPQTGKPYLFKRRKPEESMIPLSLTTLEQIYDYIRMLDAPDYPEAFLDIGNYRLTFNSAELIGRELMAKVRISIKDE